MNPIPPTALAMDGAMLSFDATPLLAGLLLVLAVGVVNLIFAAWWHRPRRALPVSTMSRDVGAERWRSRIQRQSARRGARGWPAVATFVRGALTVRKRAGGLR